MIRPLSRSLLVLILCTTTCLAANPPAGAEATPKPGFLSRTWKSTKKLNPFRGKSEKGPAAAAGVVFKGLQMNMLLDPQAPVLGEHRQVTVTLRLQNKSKKLVQLDFPTTQRIEVLLRNSTGKLVEQWSEDQAFQNEPGLVTINPGERLEYTARVSTRDMAAGQEYTIEGFFPNYENLRATAKVVPTR